MSNKTRISPPRGQIDLMQCRRFACKRCANTIFRQEFSHYEVSALQRHLSNGNDTITVWQWVCTSCNLHCQNLGQMQLLPNINEALATASDKPDSYSADDKDNEGESR